MLATGSARNTVSTERSSILFRPLPTTVGLACTSCTKDRRAPVGVGVSVHAAGKGIGLKAGNVFFWEIYHVLFQQTMRDQTFFYLSFKRVPLNHVPGLRLNARTHTRTHARTYTYTHKHTYTYTHTHTQTRRHIRAQVHAHF